MIQLPQPTENLLINAANVAGLSPVMFLDNLLREYLEDQTDIQAAAHALTESGEISLDELKAKYDL
jgi:hypothetical protein